MNKTTTQFYIGIDSGGTKCDLVITDLNKKVLFQKNFKGIHYSVYGANRCSYEISRYIRFSLKQKNLHLKKCNGICIGLAGAREEKNRLELAVMFKKRLKYNNILIETDAKTAIYGAFEGKDGIILISGTGSVLYGIYKGRLYRVGGWGRILGDGGSGYKIGQAGLSKLVKEYDLHTLNKKESLLSKKVYKHFNITQDNIVDKIFKENFEIQQIAPIVLECAEHGDKTCLNIINNAIEELSYLLETFLKVSKCKSEINLSFIGSIVEHNNILSSKLKKLIKNKLKLIKVTPKKYSASMGAILLAEKNFIA